MKIIIDIQDDDMTSQHGELIEKLLPKTIRIRGVSGPYAVNMEIVKPISTDGAPTPYLITSITWQDSESMCMRTKSH